MTDLMYINHPDLFELSAQVTQHGIDAKGMYVVFNQSLFYQYHHIVASRPLPPSTPIHLMGLAMRPAWAWRAAGAFWRAVGRRLKEVGATLWGSDRLWRGGGRFAGKHKTDVRAQVLLRFPTISSPWGLLNRRLGVLSPTSSECQTF